jgi:hypothetical protein
MPRDAGRDRFWPDAAARAAHATSEASDLGSGGQVSPTRPSRCWNPEGRSSRHRKEGATGNRKQTYTSAEFSLLDLNPLCDFKRLLGRFRTNVMKPSDLLIDHVNAQTILSRIEAC